MTDPLTGKRIAFTGRLAGMTRREARALLAERGAVPVAVGDGQQVDWLVVGEDGLPLAELEPALDASARQAARRGELEVISETQLWQRLGVIEAEQNVHPLYTAANLAHLLGIPVATIRRWQRLRLIVPVREVRRLAYFDFQQVVTARSLARLVASGVPVPQIERQLKELQQFLPEIERPLVQLSILADGKRLLLRKEGGLLDPSGQMRFDFDATGDTPHVLSAQDGETFEPEDISGRPPGDQDAAADHDAGGDEADQGQGDDKIAEVATLVSGEDSAPPTAQMLCEAAAAAEDEGDLNQAAELYRAALAAGGPDAEICFHLGDLLYRLGDLSAARERYYIAIEIDEDYIEARANLGCVLLELDQPQLAEAAFRGALASHADYADAHYHLARTLTRLDRPAEAAEHWRAFLRLAPRSPWADEAESALAANGETP